MKESLNSEKLRLILPNKDKVLFWIVNTYIDIWELNSNFESNNLPTFLTREKRSRFNIFDK